MPAMRRNKFNVTKVWMCEQGHHPGTRDAKICPTCGDPVVKFDSTKESNRWLELKLLEQYGKISDLERQVKFKLTMAHETVTHLLQRPIKIRSDGYPNGRQVTWTADFVYRENGERVVEDSKGKDTDASRLRRAIVEAMLGIEIRIT